MMTTGLIDILFTDVYLKENVIFDAFLDLNNGAILMKELNDFNHPQNVGEFVFSYITISNRGFGNEFNKNPYFADVVEIDGNDFISKEDLQYIKERV